MELRQIQSFITITQVQSFSKAAELLGYSQSAVTVQIRLLEASTLREEVRQICIAIRRLVTQQNYCYRDIAVICGDY
ncbi:LysR family transcriptional regulator, partial [Clostridium porci]|uniref:LysR family transcriptional regulator n=1 Tax=Clostridium porci TaxID=2605778 RepID=UPI003A908724